MNAGFSDSIKYSIAPKTAKKIAGILIYEGINFLMTKNYLLMMLSSNGN
jgi:hypothetical protein